jgi:hypothetical protein
MYFCQREEFIVVKFFPPMHNDADQQDRRENQMASKQNAPYRTSG